MERGRSTRFNSRPSKFGTFKSASTARSRFVFRRAATQRLLVLILEMLRQLLDDFQFARRRKTQPGKTRSDFAFQSGILDSGDSTDCFHELEPPVALAGQHLFASRGEAIITPPPLSGLFHPAAANPSPFFEPVEQGIKRSDIKPERAARAQLDQLTNVVAVPRPILDQRKNEQFRAALLQFTIQTW